VRPGQPGRGPGHALCGHVVAPGLAVRALIEPERDAAPHREHAGRARHRRPRGPGHDPAAQRVHPDQVGALGEIEPAADRVGALRHRASERPQPQPGHAVVGRHAGGRRKQHYTVHGGAEGAGERVPRRPDDGLRAGVHVDPAQRGHGLGAQVTVGRHRHIEVGTVDLPGLGGRPGGPPPADGTGPVAVGGHRGRPDDDRGLRGGGHGAAERPGGVAADLAAGRGRHDDLGPRALPRPVRHPGRDHAGPGTDRDDRGARGETGQAGVPQGLPGAGAVGAQVRAAAQHGDAVVDGRVRLAGGRNRSGQPGARRPLPREPGLPQHLPGRSGGPARIRTVPGRLGRTVPGRGIGNEGHGEQRGREHAPPCPDEGTAYHASSVPAPEFPPRP